MTEPMQRPPLEKIRFYAAAGARTCEIETALAAAANLESHLAAAEAERIALRASNNELRRLNVSGVNLGQLEDLQRRLADAAAERDLAQDNRDRLIKERNFCVDQVVKGPLSADEWVHRACHAENKVADLQRQLAEARSPAVSKAMDRFHQRRLEIERAAKEAAEARVAELEAGQVQPSYLKCLPEIAVAGPMETSIADFIRRCKLHIADEHEKPLPDNALIVTLCDAVRLAVERRYRVYQRTAAAPDARDAALEEARVWLNENCWCEEMNCNHGDEMVRALKAAVREK